MIALHLPPLRERREDLLPLARALLVEVAHELGKKALTLDDDAARELQTRAWPGNIRELRNALERAAILADTDTIGAPHLASAPGSRGTSPATSPATSNVSTATSGAAGATLSLDELERQAIERALAAVDGNRKEAAQLLGIGLRTLYDKLKRHGLGDKS